MTAILPLVVIYERYRYLKSTALTLTFITFVENSERGEGRMEGVLQS